MFKLMLGLFLIIILSLFSMSKFVLYLEQDGGQLSNLWSDNPSLAIAIGLILLIIFLMARGVAKLFK